MARVNTVGLKVVGTTGTVFDIEQALVVIVDVATAVGITIAREDDDEDVGIDSDTVDTTDGHEETAEDGHVVGFIGDDDEFEFGARAVLELT